MIQWNHPLADQLASLHQTMHAIAKKSNDLICNKEALIWYVFPSLTSLLTKDQMWDSLREQKPKPQWINKNFRESLALLIRNSSDKRFEIMLKQSSILSGSMVDSHLLETFSFNSPNRSELHSLELKSMRWKNTWNQMSEILCKTSSQDF